MRAFPACFVPVVANLTRNQGLTIVREFARGTPEQKAQVADLLPQVCLRPDDMIDFMALYWSSGRQPLAACVKRGLAKTFQRFDRAALSAAPKTGAVTLRDILFLVHPKPLNYAQARDWKDLADGNL